GGILADDMGLGKTLAVLALVLKLPPRRFSENYRGRYAGGTLIVCPLSTMGNWEEQVVTHVRAQALSIHAYHGHTRCKNPKKLCHYDVVLTTFNVLQADTKLFQVPDDPYVSPLLAVRWHRVVLDEAHNIKERRTISSIAAYSLHAERRWCLTGTPIQNRLDDLYSLLRFLHIAPVDNWRVWLTYIGAPFHKNVRALAADGEHMEEGNIGANRVQRLMQSICLRRMKRQIDAKTNRSMIELPPKFETVRWLNLAEGERRLYNMAEGIARNKFSNMSRNGTLLKNYIHILKIILRLRQLCTHPRLWAISAPAGASVSAAAARSVLTAAASSVSAASLASSVRSDHLLQQQLGDLPASRDNKDNVEDSYSELNRLCNEHDTSTKIITLLSDIDKIRKRAWFTDPCVVFSQWTTMLDLIEPLLSQQGIRFTRLDGKMQRQQRERNLYKFKHDSDIEVLLLSLRAGGVGLNLVHATHVFLMDAFWNPSVENQAIDRIHRLGQNAPVTVTRYFIKNSIEEKIMMLQRRKAKIVDISLM
ncbi:hypothetical protein COEREDRAFT_21076, partial [Coemansia reversa NRRL 1564]